jgi:hypothetical protein
MKTGKSEKFKSMTVRVDTATETKFGVIWNKLQEKEPPQIRLSRNDVFEIMVREYYQSLSSVRSNQFTHDYDYNYNSIRELE